MIQCSFIGLEPFHSQLYTRIHKMIRFMWWTHFDLSQWVELFFLKSWKAISLLSQEFSCNDYSCFTVGTVCLILLSVHWEISVCHFWEQAWVLCLFFPELSFPCSDSSVQSFLAVDPMPAVTFSPRELDFATFPPSFLFAVFGLSLL